MDWYWNCQWNEKHDEKLNYHVFSKYLPHNLIIACSKSHVSQNKLILTWKSIQNMKWMILQKAYWYRKVTAKCFYYELKSIFRLWGGNDELVVCSFFQFSQKITQKWFKWHTRVDGKIDDEAFQRLFVQYCDDRVRMIAQCGTLTTTTSTDLYS